MVSEQNPDNGAGVGGIDGVGGTCFGGATF